MKQLARANGGLSRLVVALVLLAVLSFLTVRLSVLRSKQAEDEAVGGVAKVVNVATYDGYALFAVVTIVAMFGYVMWVALRANHGEAESMPPARESSASDESARR